eukprot:TRINITY_DN48034_c0_g2_i4.p1 TRINITY_DN48034_c0_g2~~TRINITY_DN48034_c0_g2_i4.p1  ORF type:complete len:136 (-),score=24.26 TRINITY_DN48034_c0_g2_i4:107-514(-)
MMGACNDCTATVGGFVYAWSFNENAQPTKIGCTARSCNVRIKEEVEVAYQNQVLWTCCPCRAGYTWNSYVSCNAVERQAQSWYVGGQTPPNGTRGGGHATEWYNTLLVTAKKDMENKIGTAGLPSLCTTIQKGGL